MEYLELAEQIVVNLLDLPNERKDHKDYYKIQGKKVYVYYWYDEWNQFIPYIFNIDSWNLVMSFFNSYEIIFKIENNSITLDGTVYNIEVTPKNIWLKLLKHYEWV